MVIARNSVSCIILAYDSRLSCVRICRIPWGVIDLEQGGCVNSCAASARSWRNYESDKTRGVARRASAPLIITCNRRARRYFYLDFRAWSAGAAGRRKRTKERKAPMGFVELLFAGDQPRNRWMRSPSTAIQSFCAANGSTCARRRSIALFFGNFLSGIMPLNPDGR